MTSRLYKMLRGWPLAGLLSVLLLAVLVGLGCGTSKSSSKSDQSAHTGPDEAVKLDRADDGRSEATDDKSARDDDSRVMPDDHEPLSAKKKRKVAPGSAADKSADVGGGLEGEMADLEMKTEKEEEDNDESPGSETGLMMDE